MDDELNEVQSKITELTKMMEELQASIAPFEEQQKQLKAEKDNAYQEYLAKIGAINKNANAIDEKIHEARTQLNGTAHQINELSHKADNLKKQKEQEAKQAAAEEAFKSIQDRWNKLTMGAPWREWAKDHQLEAGHKITADRKVILADPMGLGKTLSAIITTDMVEAATKEASIDFPFLGEEKEVYVPGKHIWLPVDVPPELSHFSHEELLKYDSIKKEQVFIEGHYEPKIVGGVTRPAGRKVLYFCPDSMIKNVEREFRRWAPHRSVVFIGGMNKKERAFIFDIVLNGQAEYVVICNYAAWRKDLSLIDSLIDQQFDTIIIDEAHNVKETKSIAYRGIKRLIDELKPPYVIPMTGTPILNRPQELFALLTLVDPNNFYSLNDFLYRFCEQDEDGRWKFIAGGMDIVSKAIGKHFMRRTRDQAGIQLPPKTVTEHLLEVDEELYPHQAKARTEMRKNAMIMLDEAEGKAIAATAMIAVFTRLRQIETWPAGIEIKDPLTKEVKVKLDVEESQKIDYLIAQNPETKDWEGIIPEVIEDERCVLFSQFKAPLRELRDRIERMGKRAVIFDGDTPASVKDEILMDFDNTYTPNRENSKWDIVLCNYKVGGVGANLTAATQMFILDEEWNPGKRDQAYDRIHRIGQDKPITIHVIRNEKTIDDWLANIMSQKEDLVTGFNNAMVDKDAFKDALESGLL